jgi:hypothetical protein
LAIAWYSGAVFIETTIRSFADADCAKLNSEQAARVFKIEHPAVQQLDQAMHNAPRLIFAEQLGV